MSKWVPKALLVVVFALTSLLSIADSFDDQIASVVLLQIKAIQTELGITESQRTAMNKFADAHRAKLSDYYKQLESSHSRPNEAKLQEMFKVMKKGVFSEMSGAQIKRLREITLQTLDFAALADVVVGGRVGLTAAQQKQIDILVQTADRRANEIRGNAVKAATASLKDKKPTSDKEEQALVREFDQQAQAASKRVAPQINQLRVAARKQVLDILTPAEKSKWQDLLGKPFHP
jgi:hypothetical protein